MTTDPARASTDEVVSALMRAARQGLLGSVLSQDDPCLTVPAVQQATGKSAQRQEALVRLIETTIRPWDDQDRTIAQALLGIGRYQGMEYNGRLRVINKALGSNPLSGPHSLWSKTYRKSGARHLLARLVEGLNPGSALAIADERGWWLERIHYAVALPPDAETPRTSWEHRSLRAVRPGVRKWNMQFTYQGHDNHSPQPDVTFFGNGDFETTCTRVTPGDDVGLFRYFFNLSVHFVDDLPLDDLENFAIMRREIRPGEMDETEDGHLGATIRTTCDLTATVAFHPTHIPPYVWSFDGPALPGPAVPDFDPSRLLKPWPRMSASYSPKNTIAGHRYGIGWRWPAAVSSSEVNDEALGPNS